MSKAMTPEELKELQRDFDIANAHHIAESRRRQIEEIFEIVFGDDGHKRCNFLELKERIQEAVDVLTKKENLED
jgi:16S rRNA U1498 N3-methylase RsmE